ncbi:uncharacterized protein K02A2.6 [Manduca sexta]|uniref:uncharacterized protein K02A2.6 n=1 Tax=Manduca sexta TaxID=7130 RepID=UPI00118289CD|nr:uncharacterized protein K02A2.6 [Manduca sexta]XP_037303505.1 uncharacterized protein K02A2.6 [Manduca sexta]
MENLYKVFDRLRKYGLKIKKEKCVFFAESVTYLGYVISKDGIHTCPDKIEAIKNAPAPKNVTELRSFLGLVMYYAKFVANISTLLEPLYRLLKKNCKFEWNEECEQTIKNIKGLLISSRVLAHYSSGLPLILTTDASTVGIGAVISHLVPESGGSEQTISRERPIAYASRSLNSAERNYSQIEKEALSIVFGIRKFHQYLYGRKFILRTDHKPLVYIFGEKAGIPVMTASRIQRWAILLAGYDYQIEYVPSDKNGADALSRLPLPSNKESKRVETTYLNFVQDFLPVTRVNVKENTVADESLRKVVLCLQSGWPIKSDDNDLIPYWRRRTELYLDRGCIMWGYRLVVPAKLRDILLKELHVGHLGIVKMKAVARSYVWWPNIDADIERVCRECTTCIEESAAPPKASPSPWPYLTEPWSRLHIDFLGPYHGHTFLVVIDSTSKWVEAFKMVRTTAGAVIAILRETFARFGLPKEVVSDNGPPFSSKEYAAFMDKNGIKLTFTAIYHPSSNGAAEGAVKLCKRAVKKSLREGQDIEAALQTYLLAYRNVEHSTTGVSPAELLQKRKLRSRLDFLKGDREVEDRVHSIQQRHRSVNRNSSREFDTGDKVWVRNFNRGKRWDTGRVGERLGSRNYLVEREDGSCVKRHVDQMKAKSTPMFDLPCPNLKDIHQDMAAQSAAAIKTPGQDQDHKVIVEKDDLTGQPKGADTVAPDNRPKRIRRPVKRFEFD